MANAQNKLGELFVDIGLGGIGNTLKGLNTISASFLLTKTAAEQMIKPIVNTTKEFGRQATALEKLRIKFGTTPEQAQRMQAVFKLKDIESATEDIARLSDIFGKLANNEPIDPNFLRTLARLGIDITNYNNSLEDTLRLYDDIGEKLAKLNYASSEDFAKQLGVNRTNLLYARERGVRFAELPKQAQELTQQQINDLITGEENLVKLQQDVFRSLQKLFSDHVVDKIISIVNKLDNLLSGKYNKEIIDSSNFIKNNKVMNRTAFNALPLPPGAKEVSFMWEAWKTWEKSNLAPNNNIRLAPIDETKVPAQLQFEPADDLNQKAISDLVSLNNTFNYNINATDPQGVAREIRSLDEARNNSAAMVLTT